MRVQFARPKERVAIVAVLVLGAFALAACSSGGPTVVNVKLTEYAVEMDKTSIPAGPVRFVVQNAGTIVHELVLEPAGAHDAPFEADDRESEVEDVQPGTRQNLEWTISEPGSYQLSCYTPGHFEKGMFTTFTVTAP